MPGVQRNAKVVSDVVDGRAVLVDPAGRELITLNPVGTMVWAALGEHSDPLSIAAEVATRFPTVAPGVVENDVRVFLDELVGLGLVTETAVG